MPGAPAERAHCSAFARLASSPRQEQNGGRRNRLSMETLMIGCPACGATNRVPADKIARGLAPVCGKCRAPLPAGQPQPVTDASFAQAVERSPVPVLVDAWAPWCAPFHMTAPVLRQ